MAGNIKGIIVEIGGDTSGLQKALKNVNSATSSLSKELRGVNSLLKLDPTNTELVAQKQTLLSKNIEETSEKLKLLKDIQKQADDAIASGTEISEENYRALQREIANTENKLKTLQSQSSKWSTAGKAIEEFGNKITNVSDKVDKLGNTLTTSLTVPIVGLGTAAVATGNSFEAQMSRVQAIAGATKDELEQLTNQAIQLGAETSFSATEVAAGMENLASAGFTTNEIMEAMPGLLDLAASSGAELATASEIAASAIRGFGLEASEAGHVADVFAEAAARTNAQTEDMGEAMKYVAPVAKTVGLSIEETAAAIGIMSDAGIKGSQAGTTLRGALVRIVKPTKPVKEAMEELNVEFYKSDGTMKSLKEIIDDLQKSTKGLSEETKNQALAQIFGTEALSGMLALVNRGADDLEDITKSFEKADGAAEEMADTMLDNTAGSLESLSGAIESAGIAIQKALSPEIRELSEWIQDLVNDFNNLSEEEQLNIIKTVALVAGIGPLIKILGTTGKTLGTVTTGIGTFTQAIGVAAGKTVSETASVNKLANAFKFLTSPMGLATTALGLLVAGLVVAIQKHNEYAFDLSETSDKLKEAKQSQDEFNQSLNDSFNSKMSEIKNVETLADELETLVDKNGKVKKEYEGRVNFILNELNEALGTEYRLNGNLVESYDKIVDSIDELIQKKRAEIILSNEEEKYNEAIEKKSEAYNNLKQAQDELTEANNKYLEAIKNNDEQSQWIWKTQVDRAQQNVSSAQSIYQTYLNDIANYESDYETIMTGSNEEIEKLINSRTYTYQSASGDLGETINHNIQQVQSEIEYYKQAYQQDLVNQNEYSAQKNQAQKEAAEKQLQTLAEELMSMTSTTEELTPQQIEAWKNLANSSFETYKEYVNKMTPEMQLEIQHATGVLANDRNLAKESGNLASKARNKFREESKGEETGEDYVKGLTKGVDNSTVRNKLIKNVKNLGEETSTTFDNSAQSEDSGKNFVNGLKNGISSASGGLFSAVWDLGKRLVSSLNGSLDEHSPSKLTEESGTNFVQGAINGITSKEREALNLVNKFGSNLINKFNAGFNDSTWNANMANAKLNSKVIDSTKTIFTTPTLNIYTQGEVNIRKIADEVNRIFGSQY